MSDFYIKRCPFCGPDNDYEKHIVFHKATKSNHPHYTIMCGGCGAEPNFYAHSEAQAIEVWNKRSDSTDEDIYKRLKKIEDRMDYIEKLKNIDQIYTDPTAGCL